MAEIIKVCLYAKLQRASDSSCRYYNRPLGEYELLDAAGDRIMWIDGKLSPAVAKSEAHDAIAEPLLRDFYNLDTIEE